MAVFEKLSYGYGSDLREKPDPDLTFEEKPVPTFEDKPVPTFEKNRI